MANGDVSLTFTLNVAGAGSTVLISGATTASTVPGASVAAGSSTQTGRPAQ